MGRFLTEFDLYGMELDWRKRWGKGDSGLF
jgi:hypothetical protein